MRPSKRSIEDQLKSLQDHHGVVLNMPSKVSYNQMIPLSKVAFCPGKIIHTNEFKFAGKDMPPLEEQEFMSYRELANKLEDRIASLKAQVNSSKNDNVDSKKQTTISKTIAANSQESSPHDRETPLPVKNRVFEIREYLDGEKVGDAQPEVTDITDQLERMEKFMSKPEGNLPGGSYLNDDETEFLRELSEITAMDDIDEGDDGQQKVAFDNFDDMFAQLEAQQERQDRLKRKSKTSAATNGNGWKSGFLSGRKDAPKKIEEKSKKAAKVVSFEEKNEEKKEESSAAVLPVNSSDSHNQSTLPAPISSSAAEVEPSESIKVESSINKPRQPFKPAFSGMIREKFP